jgi:hypothetical protein
MRITRKFLREQCACYTDEQIAALVPKSGVTPLRCARGDIPPEDRVWVLTRTGVLPDSMLWEWTARTVDRALSRVAKPDPRSIAVVPLLRRLAKGEAISQAELDEARAAAWVAAGVADRAADRAAACAAACAAARAAARAAAGVAAREAAREAAWDADRAAAERQAQISDIIQLLEATP